MVKTHPDSFFALRDLSGINNSTDVMLQVDKTESIFTDSKKSVYLCEVVSKADYRLTPTIERLTNEVLRLNSQIDTLRRKNDRMSGEILRLKKGQ